MRTILALGCAVAFLVPSTSLAGPATTSLTITFTEDSASPTRQIRWTLRCDPVGGTHPRPTAVCRELSRLGWRVFRTPPPDAACAELYGAPQVAVVPARVGGHRVWARLTRIDQIARWDAVPSLLTPGGAS
jgi:Subtilisin inhibitor-like